MPAHEAGYGDLVTAYLRGYERLADAAPFVGGFGFNYDEVATISGLSRQSLHGARMLRNRLAHPTDDEQDPTRTELVDGLAVLTTALLAMGKAPPTVRRRTP